MANDMDCLSIESFDKVKQLILSQGDRQTYCNTYNDNPHHAFDGFDAYLNPDIGQRNIFAPAWP